MRSSEAITRSSVSWPPVAAGGVVLAAGCVVAGIVDPRGGPTLCPFKALTGLDCPGCGATRALHFAMRGDLVTAAGYNALFVLALPFVLVAVFIGLSQLFGARWRMPSLSLTPRATKVLVIAVTCFWVARNLPWAPFRALGT